MPRRDLHSNEDTLASRISLSGNFDALPALPTVMILDLLFTASVALLTAVFMVAGVEKLRLPALDLGSWARGYRRVPKLLILILASAEIALALGLLIPSLRMPSLLAALSLLSMFSALTAINLRANDEWDCQCFGSMASGKVTRWTLVRNLILIGAAAIAATLEFISAQPTKNDIAVTLLVASLMAYIITGGVSRQRWSRTAAPSDSVPTLPLYSIAPNFILPRLHGELLSLDEATIDILVMVLFVKGGCGGCAMVEPDVDRWAVEHAGRFRFLIVSTGGAAKTELFRAHTIVFQENKEVSTQFGITSGPTGILIGRGRLVLSEPVIGPVALRTFMASISTSAEVLEHPK